jgi:alkanesulfonate monooxygenase SsuD/methylene tetrahydromethanopterin reductase-like flavin-dependent oxidoreductase (luciferase family)
VQATIKAKAAPVAEAVPVEPPKIEAKAAPVKKAKGGRLEGSRNSDTNRILAAWDRHIEAGKTDEEARELVTRVECKNLKRGVKSIRQSVNNAIKKYRNNGRHNLE